MAMLDNACWVLLLLVLSHSICFAARTERQRIFSVKNLSGHHSVVGYARYRVDVLNVSDDVSQSQPIVLPAAKQLFKMRGPKPFLTGLSQFFKMRPNSWETKLIDALASFGVKQFEPWYIKFGFKALLATRWIYRQHLGIVMSSVAIRVACPEDEKRASKACRGISNTALKIANGVRMATGLITSFLENDLSMSIQQHGESPNKTSGARQYSGECTIQIEYPEPDLDCILSLACYPCVSAQPKSQNVTSLGTSLHANNTPDGSAAPSEDHDSSSIVAQLDSAAPEEIIGLLNQHSLELDSFANCLEPSVTTNCVD